MNYRETDQEEEETVNYGLYKRKRQPNKDSIHDSPASLLAWILELDKALKSH